ncbi:thioredoxin domain-containing protein [Caldichromatium japonicum]|uniref:Thioredoxin domain-containing protein n=1 Tax=Caldichromatium japonicum TaxID=2699430 RepID=A0A6G7VBG5_9GAMM|nr:thioredoxin domain-containing protein [Caldichromatium japonicum]QIK37292.1 thioredoxin domain-containing protein [Caldichromatium japonicum]
MSRAQDRSVSLANRLASAASPYLQQHATNPVAWWPWCPEALALARRLDRPILLSIGYSACHWCHVMAHESFADPETAALMNRLFINIKVDREERPDLDKVYQTAHQLLARRPGGWPLTVFLTPDDLVPFFAGTYFPPEPRYGLPSFKQLLVGVELAYREQGRDIREQNRHLLAALASLEPRGGSALPDESLLDSAVEQLALSFDPVYGGFGGAPRFPHSQDLGLLLRRHAQLLSKGRPDPRLLHMARFSLQRMIGSGLFDQIGGGFYRYAVDERWLIPHFEKMLYDNGPLLGLCADLYAITGEAPFREAALATADWVRHEMQSPEGGYYATLDADTEGQEGGLYLWDRAEVRDCLDADAYRVFAAVYGLDRPPNFKGRWHLALARRPEEVAADLGLGIHEVQGLLAAARAKLLAVRARRPRPHCDDKVLTAWNALMIQGMAHAGRLLERFELLDSAERALEFIRRTLWRDGRLIAVWREGVSGPPGYLDDHVNLIAALLEMLQVRWSASDLEWAIALAEVMIAEFQDPERGGFWLTGPLHETLIHHHKPLADESLPAGNGVAAQVLQRLGHLVGEVRYLEAAERTLKLAAESMQRLPEAHASLLIALAEWQEPPEQLVIRAEGDGLGSWQRAAQKGFQPDRLVFAIPADVPNLPGALATIRPGDGPLIYRCRGTRCLPPVASLNELEATGGEIRR